MCEPAELARRMYAAFNARNIDVVEEIFAEDFYSHPLRAGRAAVKAAWAAMIQAHPDSRAVIQDLLVDGDRVALRSHTYGITANDPGTIMEIFRVVDGRIAELWALAGER